MKRLGELLIARGLLTAGQLDAALRSQLIVGGHLGTSLIELGYVSETELGKVLAETFDVRYASAEMFEDLPRRVLDLVSKDLASRHQVIPLDASKKTVDLAMVSPNDFIALQELSFATGRRIVPLVCPEARIVQALERYYGIERPRRFVAITERLATHGATGPSADPAAAGSGAAGTPTAPMSDPFATSRPVPPASAAPAVPGAAAAATVASVAATSSAVATSAQTACGTSASAATAPRRTSADLEPLCEMLCSADSETEIVNAIGSFLERSGERLALFTVQNERARCWGVSGSGFDASTAGSIAFALEEFTLLHLLTEEPYYCGPVPSDSESEAFFRRLGVESPVEVALFPVYREGRVEAILYADSGANTGMSHGPEVYAALSRKAVLSRYLADVKARIRRR